MRMVINSLPSLSKAIGTLRESFTEHKYLTLTINTGKKRTVSQNSLSHQWYGQVADETKEYTAGEVKCLCKLNVGLPILRGIPEDERTEEVHKLCLFCDNFLDKMTYEARVAAMEYLPVTSLMSTAQLNDYLTGVQYNYSRRGVLLLFPDEWVKNGA